MGVELRMADGTYRKALPRPWEDSGWGDACGGQQDECMARNGVACGYVCRLLWLSVLLACLLVCVCAFVVEAMRGKRLG